MDVPADLPETQQMQYLLDENQALRRQLQHTNATVEQLTSIQTEIMTLLKSREPQRIVHDLRNVMNHLALLEALSEHNDRAD